MKISMKGSTKFQKRFVLCQKENSICNNIKRNRSFSSHKNQLFRRPILKNSENDIQDFSSSKHPQHLTLMNLGVDQQLKEADLNLECMTKRRVIQKCNSQAKMKLLKLTNPKNPFIVTSFSKSPNEFFIQTQNKCLNEEKKQNFFELIKRKRKANQNNYSYESSENFDETMRFKKMINLQQKKYQLKLKQSNEPFIIITKRNHKNKVLNLISNKFLKNDLQQKEEFLKKQKGSIIQNLIEKYQFKNLKESINPSLKNVSNLKDQVKTHNRHQTKGDHDFHQKIFVKSGKMFKAFTSIIDSTFDNQGDKTTTKLNRQMPSFKKLVTKRDQKQKSFRAEYLSPWDENDHHTHNIQDIF